jgi:hypothetical protein
MLETCATVRDLFRHPAQASCARTIAHITLPDHTRMASRISFPSMIERLGDKAQITHKKATRAIRDQEHSCH